MENNYRFLSDKEPTDEQLHLLMQEVAIEAKKKAVKSDEIFWLNHQKIILEVQNSELTKNLIRDEY